MKITSLALALLLLGFASIAGAVSPPIVVTPGTYGDPCLAPNTTQVTVPVAISTATLTALIAGTSGSTIYVCGYAFTESATSTAGVLFENSNATPCANVTAVTGTIGAASMASPLMVKAGVDGGPSRTQFAATGVGGLCVVSTGALVNVNGYLTYVKLKNQP